MGLNIDKVYRFVQFVSNKEFRGWVNPEEFNLGAEIAQLTLYSEMEAVFAATKKISTDMRPFVDTNDGTITSDPTLIAGLTPYTGVLSNFRHPISCRITDTRKPVKEVKESELNYRLDSSLIPPTESYPICVYRDNGIYTYPDTITGDITVTYLRKPTTPEWVDSGAGTRPIYHPSSSTDFDFDEPMFMQLAARILSHVGVNLKDEQLVQYGVAFEQKGV
jgi:hypothetical protein